MITILVVIFSSLFMINLLIINIKLKKKASAKAYFEMIQDEMLDPNFREASQITNEVIEKEDEGNEKDRPESGIDNWGLIDGEISE